MVAAAAPVTMLVAPGPIELVHASVASRFAIFANPAAAGATINRVPVLLLPGDLFATRKVAPVLQQLEAAWTQDVSVNDCFKPVSRYWDRINRAEQLPTALLEAMRVLTSPAETGAVTLALP